jgi:hypothetical protein
MSSVMSALTTALSHPFLLGGGALLLVVGYWLRSWASKHDLIDMARGAATDAAWQVTKNKGNLAAVANTEAAQKFKGLAGEFGNEKSHTGKAKKAAGYAARQAMATVAGIVGLVSLLAGLIMIGAAFFWQ